MAAATVVAASASAGSPPIIGTWQAGDHGQGGWAGGNLLSGGSLNGGGQISYHTPNGQQVAQIDVKHSTWTFTDASDTAVHFCFTLIGKQGSDFPIGVPVQDCSITIPAGTGAPVQVGGAGDPNLYGQVTLVPASQH